MTKIEKIDYIRERLPEYRATSVLFSKSDKGLDEIIAQIDGKKKEKTKEVQEIEKTVDQLKEENAKLFLKLSETRKKMYRTNEENKNKIERLEKKAAKLFKENERLKKENERLLRAKDENIAIIKIKKIKEILQCQEI